MMPWVMIKKVMIKVYEVFYLEDHCMVNLPWVVGFLSEDAYTTGGSCTGS
jgi:hypothetical protein